MANAASQAEKVSPESLGYRNKAFALVIFAYLIPILLYGIYAVQVGSGALSWAALSLGLVLSTFGSVLLLLLLRQWELLMRSRAAAILYKYSHGKQLREMDSHTLLHYEKQVQELQEELDRSEENYQAREAEFQQLFEENQTLKQQSGQLGEKVKTSSNEVEHKDHLLHEYQQTIAEQRSIIEKKQQYILKLENKVQDLNYEVKTLLQLGDLSQPLPTGEQGKSKHPVIDVFKTPYSAQDELEQVYQDLPMSSDSKVHTPYDAAMQLQRCIDKASKLSGASHLGGQSSRFLDLNVDSYAIDLRRLFDSFRNENSCVVLLYSQKEKRLLFVNNGIKNLLGWSPERFVNDFGKIIHGGMADWKHALHQLQSKSETQIRLLAKAQSGEDLLLNCYLGVIPEGVFAQHIIGVVYTN